MGIFKIKPNKWVLKANQKVRNWIANSPKKAAGLYEQVILDPQKKMNLELADYTYDRNLEMWNMQNAYNDPSAQRQRMEDAGYNPNMIAGGGSGAAGNAGSLPSYQVNAPQVDPVSFYSRIIGAANGIMNLRLGLANVRKIEGQTGKLGSETSFLEKTAGVRSGLLWDKQHYMQSQTGLANQLHAFRGGYKEGDKITDYVGKDGFLSKQATALDQTINNQKADLVFKQYRNELAKYGIYSSDNFMFRMGIQALDTIGMDPSSWLKTGSEGLAKYLKSKR